MIRRSLTMVGAVMAAIATMAMAEAPPISVDQIIVSGRHGLPRGEGSPIAARLWIKDVTVDPSAAPLLKTDIVSVRLALRQGVEKSLRNHGYLAPGEPATGSESSLAILVEMSELDIQADPQGATASVRLAVGEQTGSPTIVCLPHVATGRFRALTPLKSGGGQRATGIIFGALAGPVGGVFMANQLQNADANNVALNSRRTVAAGEGVSPQFGAPAVARHASINAIQMALVDLVKHLGETEGCKGPAKPLVATSPESLETGASPMPDTALQPATPMAGKTAE